MTSHYLFPSALHVSKTPCIVNTVLGSCVSICLWDHVLKIGGINHYMLPIWKGNGEASEKYGDIAFEKLLKKMLETGSKKNNLVAKVFGGSEVIDTTSNHFNVGEQNIKIALETLRNENIKIISKNVGGKLGRKIQFNTSTGEVLHKFIEKFNYSVILDKN